MKKSNIFKAIEFATKAHSGQFRKGTSIPYIIHPLGVAKILIENSFSDEIIIAGILHDTVEDTSVKLQDIEKEFGAKIANLVLGTSDLNRTDSWEERRRQKIKYLETAPIEVIIIECADKLDNIRAIRHDYNKLGEKLWSRFKRPKKSQEWYYQLLADVFDNRAEEAKISTLSDEFKKEVQEVFSKK